MTAMLAWSLTEGLAIEAQRGQFAEYARVVAVALAMSPFPEVVWEPSTIGPWPDTPDTAFTGKPPHHDQRWKLHTATNRANLAHAGLDAGLTWLQQQSDVSPDALQTAWADYLGRILVPSLEAKGVTMRLDGLVSIVFGRTKHYADLLATVQDAEAAWQTTYDAFKVQCLALPRGIRSPDLNRLARANQEARDKWQSAFDTLQALLCALPC